MRREEAEIRIAELRKTLSEANRRYYVDSMPTISDYDYDHLMYELQDLEAQWPEFDSPDSPTRHVGSDLNGGFAQVAHKYPMLSLANTYSIQEIEEFSARAEKALEGRQFSYCCELKFDGTAICLCYEGGRLRRALTRGDGAKGDDVTRNVRHISNIPQRLSGDFPPELEIRGEILMPYSSFDALNASRLDSEQEPFANPRNAASGSLKLLDPEEVGRRGLMCTLYHIPAQSVEFESHDLALKKASSWGLPVSEHRRICRDIDGIKEFIEYWDTSRRSLPFATDGIVIKINELDCQRALGYTSKSPRWAVAYKFKAEQALTGIVSIDFQVGRTGAVTPVANLKPVQLSGTVVKRATLNNADQMELLDIHVGDSVYVEKGGEIIPKITGVEPSLRKAGAAKPEFPRTCPDCGTPLVRREDEAKWFCPNSESCPTQIKGRILHFCSRGAMDILAGESTVDQLYSHGLVRTPADLYDLRKEQLMMLEGWREKSAQRFLDSLQASKEVPFERVLFALGIRFVGQTTARTVAAHFGSVDAIAMAEESSLGQVPDVGEVIARSIFDYFLDARHAIEIQRLRAHGLRFSTDGGSEMLSDALAGKSIVISGNFSISRERMKELIVRNGATASSSLSGRTSFLLAGSKPGPEKLRKCAELGIRIIDEKEFRELLPGDVNAAFFDADRPEEEEATLFG